MAVHFLYKKSEYSEESACALAIRIDPQRQIIQNI